MTSRPRPPRERAHRHDRFLVLVGETETGELEAHGPYDELTAKSVSDALRSELGSRDPARMVVDVARVVPDTAAQLSALTMRTGSGTPDALDARIRRELTSTYSMLDQPEPHHDMVGRMEARENHALRAVLDECRVLDTDIDTAQLAEDIRVIIAVALHLDIEVSAADTPSSTQR